MRDFDESEMKMSFRGYDRDYVDDLLEEKDRLLSVARRDMESLKREIISLKKQLNYSKAKKK